MVTTEPGWSKTTIARDDLILWLKSRGFTKGFFFPETNNSGGPDYLKRDHEKYAAKLAAAVNAWLAVANDPTPSPKTPKQRLEVWLRKNAGEYGLTKEDGNPNETGIEEITKVSPITQNDGHFFQQVDGSWLIELTNGALPRTPRFY